MNLYLERTRAGEWRIVNDDNHQFTLDEARALINQIDSPVRDCNLAFMRLVRENFDIAAVARFYDQKR